MDKNEEVLKRSEIIYPKIKLILRRSTQIGEEDCLENS